MKTLVTALCVTLMLGCGANKKEGKFNEAQAKQASTSNINTALELNTSTSETAGETAATQFQTTAQSSGASIVSPTAMLLPAVFGKEGAFAAGTRTCANKKCTFQDYSSSNSSGSLTINGAIDWNGGHILTGPDLTYKLSSAGLEWDTKLKVDLTTSDTSINGFIESSGKGTLQGGSSLGGVSGVGGWEYSSKVEYKSVTLANGKPTGGSVVVTSDYTVGGQTYTGSGTINYP